MVKTDRLGLRWEDETSGAIVVEYAYSGDLSVGAVQRRTNGIWSYRMEAVHSKWITKGRGEVRSKVLAKRALRRAWRTWLEHAALQSISDGYDWQPIETVPEGENVLLFFPEGERGNGGVEAGMIFYDPAGAPDLTCAWTHGGPNAGSDWSFERTGKPTRWCRIKFPGLDKVVA